MRSYPVLWLTFLAACAQGPSADKKSEQAPVAASENHETVAKEAAETEAAEAAPPSAPPAPVTPKANLAMTSSGKRWVNDPEGFTSVVYLDSTILLDIKYATTDNFMKTKIYDCPHCLLRPEVAEAVVKVHQSLKRKGFGLKMFDCYRPRPYQQRLWDKVPNPDYVTPPAKGSMHSRGTAVDLTVVDARGRELDMGTPYDFFGREAHTDITDLPKRVLANRQMLREAMEAAGFKGIRTEWWHFSHQGKSWPLSDYVWTCH